jgi:WD40 repeat protein
VVPIEGGTARELKGFSTEANARAVAFSPDGRLVAAAPDVAPVSDKVIRVWDIESGVQKIEVPVPGAAEDSGDVTFGLEFSSNDHLLVGHPKSDPGLALYDLRNGEWKSLANFRAEHFVLSRSGGFGFAGGDQLMRFSLDGAATPVPSHGLVGSVAMDSKARVLASAGKDGAVRIGPVSGKDPYLMFGHKGAISALAFSPEGHWLASAGEDRAIRLWRVPEVTSTPPHRRSHEDFLAMLRSWTNLRVVQDPGSATGYKVEPGPFPGWKTFPTW